MASRASAATGGLPLALAAVFWVSMAWRTACRPPRSSCSATGICSGRSVANIALRCTVDVGAVGTLAAGRAAVTVTRPASAGPAWAAPATWAVATIAALASVARARRAPRRRTAGPRRPPRRSPRSPSSSAPPLPRAGGEDHRHVRRPLRGALHLDPPLGLLRGAGGLRRGERQDLDALEPDLDVGPQHGTDVLAGRHQGGRRRCPWAGARRRRARSTTRRPSGSSARCRSGVTCGGHATSPGTGLPMPGPDRHPVTWTGRPQECGNRRDGSPPTVMRCDGPMSLQEDPR